MVPLLEQGSHQILYYLATAPHVVWAFWWLHIAAFSLIYPKKKSVRIACGPLTELIPFDHISAMLSGEISLYRKFASKMYEGLVYTDVLLRRMHICKFLREVVYEGPNFMELTHSQGHPQGRQGVLSLKCISFPDHCNREHGHIVNRVCGQIWPQYHKKDLCSETVIGFHSNGLARYEFGLAVMYLLALRLVWFTMKM